MSIAAMKQALEALGRCTKYEQRDYDAMDALRAAIAEQEKCEPVAKVVFDTRIEQGVLVSKTRPQIFRTEFDLMRLEPDTFLYAHPAPVERCEHVPVTTFGGDYCIKCDAPIEKAEPVATKLSCDPYDNRHGPWFAVDDCATLNALPNGTKLYTHPAPVPVGYMEIYVGNGQFAKIDVEDYDKVKGYWWSLSTKRGFTQYAQAHSSHDSKSRLHLSMHRLILGLTDTGLVDHINGDGIDNRKSNLRIATTQENAFNQKSNRGSSKFKGVSFRKDNNLWRAYITKDGKRTYLGDHATEVDAAMAYNKAASQQFGIYARLNHVG
jgi:hypothetical protein